MSTPEAPPNGLKLNGLKKRMGGAAFAFRGYNITNLGRTPELLAHPKYGPIVKEHLERASAVCADITGQKVDLVNRVARSLESTLETYAEDIALTVAVELAQLELLEKFFSITFGEARFAFGYSLGEIAAVVAAGIYEMDAVLRPILALAEDAAALAHDVEMGILFSRGPAIDMHLVRKLCLKITNEGNGTIAVSTFLSPNTALLLGQRETVDRFKDIMHESLTARVHLRKNPNRWPPIHTPITWQRQIPNRAGLILETLPGGFNAPSIPILSCITGSMSYNDYNSREILNQWVDRPQQLWSVIDKSLSEGVETVIHVGAEPNIVPATYERLANNVTVQLAGRSFASMGLRAVSRIIRNRRWLSSRLSSDAALLRAPFVEHVVLENWLLAQEVK